MDDGESLEETYEDSVTVQSTPFASFDSFAGYTAQKRQLQELVVEPAGYEQYVTTSVLLLGDHPDSQTERLAKGLTGAVGKEYSFYHIDSVTGDFMDEMNNLEAVLATAQSQAPSFVLITCLDAYGFDEAEYKLLQSKVKALQQTSKRVTIVCTAEDTDVDLTGYDTLFEVVVDVPKPGDAFRREIITTELDRATSANVIEFTATESESLATIDLADLTLQELRTAVKRTIQRRRRTGETATPPVTPAHLQESINIVEAEALEESGGMPFFGGDSTEEFEPDIPSVTFRDIGGLTEEKQRIREAVTKPVEYSDTFRQAGYSVGQGILLHGPPGNGKTMLAKAVANELSYQFLSVKGPELEQPLVGESEHQLRELFQTAREHTPSVVFFDEFDSLAPSRNTDTPVWKDDLVNTLLSELDGLEPLDDVIVMAATNRLDELDDAVLRSGRFDTFVEVPAPSKSDQRDIFAVHTDNLPTADDVTTEWFSSLNVAGLSGADIMAICRKALEFAVRDFDTNTTSQLEVSRSNVSAAVGQLRLQHQHQRDSRGFQ